MAPRGHLKRALWEDDFLLSANSPALLQGIRSSCSSPTPTPLPQKEKKCKFFKPKLRHGKEYRDGLRMNETPQNFFSFSIYFFLPKAGEAVLQGRDYKHTAFDTPEGKRWAKGSVEVQSSAQTCKSERDFLAEPLWRASGSQYLWRCSSVHTRRLSVNPGPVSSSSESTCSKWHVAAQELTAITNDISRLWALSNKGIIERSVSFQSRRRPMTDSWISVLRFQAKWVLQWPLALALSQRLN